MAQGCLSGLLAVQRAQVGVITLLLGFYQLGAS